MSKAQWIKIGCVTVDGAQLLISDPSYISRGFSFEEACKRDEGKPYNSNFLDGHAIVFQSGEGDGVYPVFARIVRGWIKEVKIDFTQECDCDE